MAELATVESNEVLQIYVLKRIKELADETINKRKNELLLTHPEGVKDKDGLTVAFADVKGKTSFDEKRAAEYLEKALPKDEFNKFINLVITPKVPVNKIPMEALDTLTQYFDVQKTVNIFEDDLKTLPLTAEEIKANCYTEKTGYVRMDTKSKISNRELAEIVKARNALVIDTLLLGE